LEEFLRAQLEMKLIVQDSVKEREDSLNIIKVKLMDQIQDSVSIKNYIHHLNGKNKSS